MSYRECAEDTKRQVDLSISYQQEVYNLTRKIYDYKAVMDEIDPGVNEYVLNLFNIMSLHMSALGHLVLAANIKNSAVLNPYKHNNN